VTSAPHPVLSTTSRAISGPLAWAALALLAVFVVFSAAAPPLTSTWELLLNEGLTMPFRIAIAWVAIVVARDPRNERTARDAWHLFAAGVSLSAFTALLRLASIAGVGVPAGTRLALVVPELVAILGSLWLLTRLRRAPGRAADWFDAAVIVVAGFMLCAHFITRGNPFDSSPLELPRWLFLLYLVTDVLAVFLAGTAWFRRPEGVSRVTLGLLTLGFAVIAVADLQLDQEMQRGARQPGGLLDAAIAVGFTLMLLGLDAQRRWRPTAAVPRPEIRTGRHVVGPVAVVLAMVPIVQEAWRPAHRPQEMAFLVSGMALLLALALARQVLALRRAEELSRARAEADARFRSLVQRSSDAIFQLSASHVIEWASPSAGELTGSLPARLQGRAIAEFAHPDDRDGLGVFLANAGESFARNTAYKWRMGRPGHWHDVESVVSDTSADSATRSLVLNTRNITERVRLEQQLRQVQKLEAVGRLAGGIAHDFNNILAAIITHAQLVRDDLLPADPRARDLLEIEQTAQRGAVLTRRLLSFSRPEAGEQHTQQLAVVLRGMEPMLRRLLVGQVELALELSADELWVRAAEGQIEQILMNLAINARDAMPEGGVVRVSTLLQNVRPGETGRIGVPGVLPGRWAELQVRDSGAGMDEHTLANLFEPFFTTKPTGLGTGLGLTTVRGIVRALGGYVHAESAPGQGTTMRVLLPLAPSGTVPGPVEEAPPLPGVLGRPRILVVDDEFALRNGMERYLSRHGYDALGAGSGTEALELLDAEGWEVDLVVTDMVMPRMGGRELVRRVRERDGTMPVLCMSGHVEWETEDAALEDAPWAPDRLLAKPFSFDELLQRVQEALDRAAAGRK
jgi:PAS domain S-box-containing protein